MLIVMKADATERDIAEVERRITEMGFRPHSVPGPSRTAICVTGNQGSVDITPFENMSGVAEAIRVTKPYKLISLDLRPEKTVVKVGDAEIGGEEMAIIAGPCAVESHEQAFEIAEAVRRSGARFFRGGAYKPRTSPYAFQGLGEDGLKILADVREAFASIHTRDKDEWAGAFMRVADKYAEEARTLTATNPAKADADYAELDSVADLFRQIGYDERVHKEESLARMREPRFR